MENKVILRLNDPDQFTFLEYLLVMANVDYVVEVSDGKYGITPPYLIVNGVPIDEERSLKWVKEQM